MKYLNIKKAWHGLLGCYRKKGMVACVVIPVIAGCVPGNGNTDSTSTDAESDSACVDTCTVIVDGQSSDSVRQAHNNEENKVIIEFLTNMYNNSLYYEYDFLENHCSRPLLTMLENDYDYDHEGVAYAIWDFRTSAQDGKPDSDNTNKIINVESVGDGWFTYEFYDQGWRGKKRVKAFVKDGEVIMDALETLYDECYDTYYQTEE